MRSSKWKNFLLHQSFQPGFIGLFINPFYIARLGLFRNIRRFAPQLKGKLLDFGCGRKPYRNLFKVDAYIGIDMENTGHDHKNSIVDVFYDGKHIPFDDESFDSIFCSEVLEHIFNPEVILPELNRVLKRGSKILITAPFGWNEHEVPFDYGRYTSFGLKNLLEKNGFTVIKSEKSGNFISATFQLWALYFYEIFKKWGRSGYLISLLFVVPINLAGLILAMVLPNNKSLYLNNIILAEKPQ